MRRNISGIRLRQQSAVPESARKDLDVMLGTWVDDCVGTSGGDTSVGELRVPLDLQVWSVVEEGLFHPHNLND